MKFIYLAAGENRFHLDSNKEEPKCLSLFSENETIIDKVLDNLNKVGIKKRIVVGGYKILAIMNSHPRLKYFYNDSWQETKSLFSLERAKTEFNDDLIISYSDVVYNEKILNDLMVSESDISIGYDSKWKDRYTGRNNEILKDAEKLSLTLNNEISIGKNNSANVIGEFIGLFKINRSLSNNLAKEIHSILSKNKSASVCDLINILSKKNSVSLVDVKGKWAELDTPQDLFHFKFGTKAETLKKLEDKLQYSKVLEQYKFTIKDYENNPNLIINNIQSSLHSEKLVIRSSALNEDTHSSSMAGNYESILNVITLDKSSISYAIDQVIDSYLKGGQAKELNNQILVQPQLEGVQMSGVAFTKDLETSAPYYTINYEVSEKTDSITSGIGSGDQYTYIHSKSSSSLPENKLLALLIKSIKEVESYTKHSSIDVEFALANNEIYILQVRPIAAHKNNVEVFESDIQKELENIKEYIKINNSITIPKIVGSNTVYGVMPDWNPAEIIGIKPHPLAFDLYKYIITDSVWSETRAELGYRDIGYHPGIYSFSGQPFVDVRMSFNTFTPKAINDATATRLVNNYISKLKSSPELHDKVEFDVAITSYDFTFDDKMNSLRKSGFSNEEIKEIENAFVELTKNILLEKVTNIDKELKKTISLTEKREAIVNSEISVSEKIVKLLEDCRQDGTKPFSILARLGFISSILMKSLLKKDVITNEEYHDFFGTIQTVATDFVEDLKKVTLKLEMSKNEFIKKYGHLRPGTYDINSKSYKENFDKYINLSNDKHEEIKSKNTKFVFTKKTLKLIDNELILSGLNISVKAFLDFVKKSTEARELAKFEFTKNLSLILDYIIEFGNELGIDNRSDLAYINLEDIIKVSYGSRSSNITNEICDKIQYNKKKHTITSAIKLPSLIFSEDDVDGFFYENSKPNFTTQLIIEGELAVLKDEKKDILDKIVVIENADPGFDWIFSHRIKGLITKYGGAASHMAIRCSEFGLPAAIGCGEKIFDSLNDKDLIQLDCLNQKINKF
tara:strand:+ start:1304 stop:4369 length:3066 start_codon:yes stop_codon:yes gene_type:complete